MMDHTLVFRLGNLRTSTETSSGDDQVFVFDPRSVALHKLTRTRKYAWCKQRFNIRMEALAGWTICVLSLFAAIIIAKACVQ